MDAVDRQLVGLLMRDGRASYADLAKDVGLSVSATKRRVDRLVDDDVIERFTAVVGPEVLGWQLSAVIQLYTNGTVPFSTMRRDLGGLSEVVWAYTVSGRADAILRVVATDVAHLERVISRVRRLPYVQQTDTTMLLSSLLPRQSVLGTGELP